MVLGHAVRTLAATRAFGVQWLPEHRLRASRLRSLRRTLAHAARVSPFYRELWKRSGADPGELRSLADLRHFPVVDKTVLREHAEEILDPGTDLRTASVEHTSGSTGQTLRVVHGADEAAYLNAVWMRSHVAYGLRPHHRMAYFKNLPSEPGLTDRLGIFRSHFLSPEEDPERLWRRLAEIRPHVLGGYPSHLADLVSVLPADRLRSLGVRWLNTGSEDLSPTVRDRLTEVFGCPIVDLYGCCEFGSVAFQCAHGNRHVNDDTVLVEVLDGDRPAEPGVTGELVITGLRGRAMPLVRYRIGDRGALSAEPCPCGRRFTLLTALEGRSGTVVVTPEGRRFTFTHLCEFVHRIDTLFQFQFVQDVPEAVTLNLVCAPGTEEETVRRATDLVTAQLGPSVTVTPQVLPAIPRTPGGKVLPIVSRVPGR